METHIFKNLIQPTLSFIQKVKGWFCIVLTCPQIDSWILTVYKLILNTNYKSGTTYAKYLCYTQTLGDTFSRNGISDQSTNLGQAGFYFNSH